MHQWIGSALVQMMSCRIFSASHYLNQCWAIVNWTLRNKFQPIFCQNIKLFIHKSASENIVWDMVAILSSLFYVRKSFAKYTELEMDFALSVYSTYIIWYFVHSTPHCHPSDQYDNYCWSKCCKSYLWQSSIMTTTLLENGNPRKVLWIAFNYLDCHLPHLRHFLLDWYAVFYCNNLNMLKCNHVCTNKIIYWFIWYNAWNNK